ncbi:MAG: hypothetical protein LBT24_00950, partial [Tannerella sp.]|nr:hypothetical protein [Tannerella sp.]
MNLLNFRTLFQSKASCKAKWKEYFDKQGVSTKKNFSASELQGQLGHSTYNPILAMWHKLCQVMGLHGTRYQFAGVVEFDEGFFSTKTAEDFETGSRSQKKRKDLIRKHYPRVTPRNEVSKLLTWIHIAISNTRQMLPDIFHDIKPEYLQNCMN